MVEAIEMMQTVRGVLEAATHRLRRAAVPEPRLDASLLLSAVMGEGRASLWARGEQALTAAQIRDFQRYVDERARRRPVAQIVGRREFWSLEFRVTADVLDPRPDSETLVEAALAAQADRLQPLRLLDLGTGSGCLLLALLSELPGASGLGVDRSPAALAVATANAQGLGLAGRCRFLAGDWASAIAGRFDVVLSNPPYLAKDELSEVAPEVGEYEPRSALDGGDDGFAAYRTIVPELPSLLTPGGRVYLECGPGQAGPLSDMMAAVGLREIVRRHDLAGHARCVAATL